MKKIVLYMHGGSANHGCEAIVNTTCKIVKRPVVLLSANAMEDLKYSLKDLCEIRQEKNPLKHFTMHILLYIKKYLLKDESAYMKYILSPIRTKKDYQVNLMIGGDNYCYGFLVKDMRISNTILNKFGGRTILWGCSIEPDLLKDSMVIEDLKQYSGISARESITYQALLNAGITKNVHLFPDPAFTLEPVKKLLPIIFKEGNTVGINISPMILEHEKQKGIVLKNYVSLIEWILTNTDMNVALIPHVVRENNDDRKPLLELLQHFETSDRICMIPDCSCTELKGYVARCRFFIGARTHATIAAYSSMVPTVVVGYSVKARGIARDIFGTEDKYVISVQAMNEPDNLVKSFKWLLAKEKEIRMHLEQFMPGYIEKAYQAIQVIEAIEEHSNI